MTDYFSLFWGLTLFFTWPALVLPLLLGTFSLLKYGGDDMSRLASVFALKPVIATPIWALLCAITLGMAPFLGYIPLSLASPIYWLTLLPGLGLTVAIVLLFRKLFQTKAPLAFVLLGCDMIRWIWTFLIYPESGPLSSYDTPYHLALLLPNLYAIMALVIAVARARVRRSPEGGAG